MFYFSDESSLKNIDFNIGDTLEIAAQCAVEKGDIPAFERALAQLKPFYFDLEYVDFIFFLFINHFVFIEVYRNHLIVIYYLG
jgi:hypothetical protein